jgi:hypothetical protein
MSIERRAGFEYADGTIREHRLSLEFAVRLDDGRNVAAVLSKSRFRKSGCLMGNLVGWRVTIVFRTAPKPPAILEIRQADGPKDTIG